MGEYREGRTRLLADYLQIGFNFRCYHVMNCLTRDPCLSPGVPVVLDWWTGCSEGGDGRTAGVR